MNCKGCKHCVLVSKIDNPYLKASFHYCDKFLSSVEPPGKIYKEFGGKCYEQKSPPMA